MLEELDENLAISRVEKLGKVLYIYCDLNGTVANCKYCGMESHSVHSKYIRTISDLPIQDYQVKLVIIVPKFFCANERCSHKTFAYPIPFAAANTIRTKRLDDYIYRIGMKNSSLEAEKLISDSHVSVSNNTILRIIKKADPVINYEVKNISIDDFSHCKRKIYFSILVDNDTGKRLEVVPSRQQPEVIKMLRKFKQAATVTRDFSKSYKAAISEASPNARQIVDRFHILKNLPEDMADYLKRKIRDNIKVPDLSTMPITEKEVLNTRERRKIETGLKKWETAREAQERKKSGKNNTEIAKMLRISRPTVIKYPGMSKPPIAFRPRKLDPYIPRIKELLWDGYRYIEIFNQIKKEGYAGGISLYNSKMKGIRWEVSQKIRYLKRSDIKKLLYTPLEAIPDSQKRRDTEKYLNGHPELKQILELVSDFKALLIGSDENKLDEWLKRAENMGIAELDSFLKLIRSDEEAVKNAIRYPYSNGPTEGHNNKIKVIKRQMYGRCKFDLLRLKILC